LSLSAPADGASVTAGAYSKDNGTFEEFAQTRFLAVHELYKQVAAERRFVVNGLKVIWTEYEGIWPGNSESTYYITTCIEVRTGLFVSLSITTSRKEFTRNRKLYEGIVASVQPAA
jgi:hypothetical protein